MKFAPLNIPLKRRLQTLGVAVLMFEPYLAFLVLTYISIWLLWTDYYWIVLAYAMWYWYDLNQDERGGRRWARVRKQWFIEWSKDYFPAKLVKTADLSPDRNYVIGYHPHGISCAGLVLNFSDVGGFDASFPGIVSHVLTLRFDFFLPFCRELILWGGACAASRKTIRYLLKRKGTGRATIIVVGGAQESLNAHPQQDYVLTLKNRNGFVKEALINDADTFRQVANLPGSKLRRFQEGLKRLLNITIPLRYGRGFFQYSFGFLPHRSPLTSVVGRPIRVERVVNPAQEQIDELHSRYIKELFDLYEKHLDA